MTASISSEGTKKSDLYLNQGPRNSRFPLNLTDKLTDGRTLVFIFGTKNTWRVTTLHILYTLTRKIIIIINSIQGTILFTQIDPQQIFSDYFQKVLPPKLWKICLVILNSASPGQLSSLDIYTFIFLPLHLIRLIPQRTVANNLRPDRLAGPKALDPNYCRQPTLWFHDPCLEVLYCACLEPRHSNYS